LEQLALGITSCSRGTPIQVIRPLPTVPEVRLRSALVTAFALKLVMVGGVCVILAACGGGPDAAPAANATNSTVAPPAATPATARTRYLLVRLPVAIVEETSSGPAFQVRVRFDRRPPSDAQGVKVNILVGRSGSDAPPAAYGDRGRFCYTASIGNDVGGGDPTLDDVRPGSRVRVSVRISGQPSIVRSVTARSKTSAREPLATLSCGKR
jgi:hypothetical protein